MWHPHCGDSGANSCVRPFKPLNDSWLLLGQPVWIVVGAATQHPHDVQATVYLSKWQWGFPEEQWRGGQQKKIPLSISNCSRFWESPIWATVHKIWTYLAQFRPHKASQKVWDPPPHHQHLKGLGCKHGANQRHLMKLARLCHRFTVHIVWHHLLSRYVYTDPNITLIKLMVLRAISPCLQMSVQIKNLQA